MKKILIMLIILLSAFFMRGNSVYNMIQRVSSKNVLLVYDGIQFLSMTNKDKGIGCKAIRLLNWTWEEIENEENDETSNPQQGSVIDKNENGGPTSTKPQSSTSSKPSKTCKRVYVIDKAEQKEEGHYEVIHHPEVTKVERSYKEYMEYCFYRDDGSSWIYKDYEKNFSADAYLNNHADEFSRYTFSKKYDEIKKTVVVSAAYDEEVWVVDVPYIAEKGHYEEICE